LSDIDRRVLRVLQDGLPPGRTPYRDMAGRIGIDTAELLEILKNWKDTTRLRRIGAIVNHFRVGLGAGAMVLWQVEPERIEQVGEILAGFEQASHVYQRATTENWPYNLYTMVHGAGEQDVRRIVEQMSRACGVSEYRMLVTKEELKKAPPTYITDEQA